MKGKETRIVEFMDGFSPSISGTTTGSRRTVRSSSMI